MQRMINARETKPALTSRNWCGCAVMLPVRSLGPVLVPSLKQSPTSPPPCCPDRHFMGRAWTLALVTVTLACSVVMGTGFVRLRICSDKGTPGVGAAIAVLAYAHHERAGLRIVWTGARRHADRPRTTPRATASLYGLLAGALPLTGLIHKILPRSVSRLRAGSGTRRTPMAGRCAGARTTRRRKPGPPRRAPRG